MKLESLIYVKELIERDVRRHKKLLEEVKRELREAEDKECVHWNTPDAKVSDYVMDLRENKQIVLEELRCAEKALNELMENDWR